MKFDDRWTTRIHMDPTRDSRHHHFMRRLGLFVFFLTGCFSSHEPNAIGDGPYLEIILIGAETRARQVVEVEVETESGLEQTYIRRPADDFLIGQRVALFSPVENGFYRITLRVLGPRGVVYDTEVIARVDGPTTITVVMNPPCVDESCPFGQVCRDGRCMEALLCRFAHDCFDLGDCGMAFCEEGRCGVRDDPASCDSGLCLDHVCQ